MLYCTSLFHNTVLEDGREGRVTKDYFVCCQSVSNKHASIHDSFVETPYMVHMLLNVESNRYELHAVKFTLYVTQNLFFEDFF